MAWPNVYGLDVGKFDVDAGARPPPKPSIVLIHDAFHTPAHFEQLARELQDVHGYRVLAPQLPSAASGTQQANTVLEADVQTLFEHARSEIEMGRDVVFVMHGYSGVPGPVAAERVNRYALTRPRTGFVSKLVFFSGVVANAGESYLDILRPEWMLHENGILRVRKPEQVFFQDCNPEVNQRAVAFLRPQLAMSMRTRITVAGWLHIPCVYVVCDLDAAIPRTWQLHLARKIQATDRLLALMNIQAGHAPFLSRTRETAASIVRAIVDC